MELQRAREEVEAMASIAMAERMSREREEKRGEDTDEDSVEASGTHASRHKNANGSGSSKMGQSERKENAFLRRKYKKMAGETIVVSNSTTGERGRRPRLSSRFSGGKGEEQLSSMYWVGCIWVSWVRRVQREWACRAHSHFRKDRSR